jgi:hypothetical protein
MAFQLWSWIFIILSLPIRPSYAHVSHNYEVLAGRALERVFIRGFADEQQSRNTFIALAIAAGVVLLAVIAGIFLLYLRQKAIQKVPEPEAGLTDAKPHWWMVEGKNEKMDWWRLSHRLSPTPGVESPKSDSGRSRIERLKDALNIQRKRNNQPILPTHRPLAPSPTDTLNLPMQTNANIQPSYPDSLERGYRAPLYPVQSPPQIPIVTMTMYDGGRPLKRGPSVPPRAIITQGQRTTLSRSGARSGVPRSPAGRRWLSRNSFRHPFLPLKDTDSSLLKISAPVPITVDPFNPKLNYAISIKEPRAAPTPPGAPRNLVVPPVPSKVGLRKPILPAPLQLEEPFGQPKFRGGLPASPRLGLPVSPRPPRASPVI